jgi:hypothetical protein
MLTLFAKFHHSVRHRLHGHGHGHGHVHGHGHGQRQAQDDPGMRTAAYAGIRGEISTLCPLCDRHCPLASPACGKRIAHAEAKGG